ncbi:MAG: peptidoglycan-binding protein, partial [Acidimicrobiales bacterium]
EESDCAGAGSTSTTCSSDESQVTTDDQQVTTDHLSVTQGNQKVTQDETTLSQAKKKQSEGATKAESTLAAAEQTLANAKVALAAAEEAESIRGGAYSKLPKVGAVVTDGETLYTVGTTPVVLLYGTTPATRNLDVGESGPDVAELNSDLRALGYAAPAGGTFTAQTASAVDAFQAHTGLTETGNLALGQVVFLPTSARVTKVTGVLGLSAAPGSTVLTASSTTKQVAILLDADLQADVKVGDPVTITLPDQDTTPGVVSYVGTVATVPSSSGNTHTGGSTPTITVDVTPSDPSSIGNFASAPVTVSITNASVRNVLVVPVDALLALSSGGYALEVVPAHGPHYLVPVTTGLFDDQEGLVQVSGSQIHIGMRVVVPST